MIPTIIDRLLQSIKITGQVLEQFTKKCVVSIKADNERCLELLENSTAYATLLTPSLGYETVSAVVKEAVKTNKTIREIIVGKKLLSNKQLDAIINSFMP
jgi:aspartate ammonia-lyase